MELADNIRDDVIENLRFINQQQSGQSSSLSSEGRKLISTYQERLGKVVKAQKGYWDTAKSAQDGLNDYERVKGSSHYGKANVDKFLEQVNSLV